MKIAIITSSYPGQSGPGSVGAPFLPPFISGLLTAGNEVAVIAPEAERGAVPDDPAPAYTFRVRLGRHRLVDAASFSFSLMPFYLSFFLRGGLATFRALRLRRPDHVLACWAVPSGIFALLGRWLLGIPFSVWCLGSDVWKLRNHAFGRFLLRLVFTRARKVFADGIGLASIVTRLSGRPCEFLATTRPLDTRHSYPVAKAPGKVRFLFVGRLDYDKGPDLLIDAFQRAHARNPAVELFILGSGSLEPALRSSVERSGLAGAVVLLGPGQERDIVSHMLVSDGVVIPSRFDSIPLVLSEAIQSGKPLVVTDVGDTGDIVRRFGIGLVAKKEDPGDLADKLLAFASGNRHDFMPGFRKAGELFSLKTSVSVFLNSLDH